MKIGLATCTTLPEVDIDEAITVEAFQKRGHEVSMVAWDDPSHQVEGLDALIVRSTWNYPFLHREFASWIEEVNRKTRLLNPADIMLGNLNKRYLQNLETRGIPVVPTHYLESSRAEDLRLLLTVKSVLKPAIGAASLDTQVFEPHEVGAAVAWLQSQEPGREFLVQPFLASVNTVGEQSIIVIGGEPTHRIRKHPRFADGEENVEGPLEITSEFVELVQQILEPIRERILYARIDLMMDEEGRWRLSELELIEPSLFFVYKPEALEPFVQRAEELVRAAVAGPRKKY